ncbi:expressed unknown protein [Seminavis robusta]|uniref:Uncharacterized protein n=1 Tax=Seminavis robusta TaxID=568900 RepID=A0A9N8D7T8_9STRA|nr:expressed unknown protein [Seminavis robusta]|eukprot:Sro32_g020910.1 n/a (229) ;mRNA; r:108482-109168
MALTSRSVLGLMFDMPLQPVELTTALPVSISASTTMRDRSLFLLERSFPSILTADDTSVSLLSPQTQSRQMSDAMVLKTLQGTKWRLTAAPTDSNNKSIPNVCQQQYLIFQGFSDQPNKGIVQCTCGGTTDTTTTASTGRWLSKPSEIRKGAVQLSARWKVKLATAQTAVIFKGFIRADPTLSSGGGTVAAEMKGFILSVEPEQTLGKFRADLVGINIADDELKMGIQ